MRSMDSGFVEEEDERRMETWNISDILEEHEQLWELGLRFTNPNCSFSLCYHQNFNS